MMIIDECYESFCCLFQWFVFLYLNLSFSSLNLMSYYLFVKKVDHQTFTVSSQWKKFVSLTKGILLKCVLFCFSPISMNCIKVSNHFLSLYSFSSYLQGPNLLCTS